METNATQQEILLVTGTHFSSREWVEKDSASNQQQPTENDRLKEACWNGLIWEVFPEILVRTPQPLKLYLWQILEARHFLMMELGDLPNEIDKNFSIDPYYFMHVQSYN